jgi:ABC transporter fused permease/ATP-binding protein
MAEKKAFPWQRLIELARPELPLLSAATVALLVSSGMALAYPAVIRELVDVVAESGDRAALDRSVVLLVATFLIQAGFGMLRSWWFTVAGERVVTRLRRQLFASIIRQDVAFFDEVRTGELTNRLASDTSVLQNTVTVNISMLLRFVLGAIGGVGLLFWMSPVLTGITMLIVPFVAIGAVVFGRMIRTLSKDVQDALARSSEVAEETLGGIRTVRAFAAEAREIERYDVANQHSYALAARRAFASGAFQGVAGFAGYAAIALVVWFGGRMVIDHTMTLGDLTAFLLYTLTVAMSLGALAGLWGDFMRAFGASERVFQLMDQLPAVERDGGAPVGELRGEVQFDAVGFAYPSRPDVPVLRDVAFTVAPGEVVALAGPSGAGKSTIAGLLLRFYDPVSGAVKVDGRDVRELDADALRRHIGVVSQEPILFATSIAENIRYGRPDATQAEVEAAAIAANCDGFIRAFPQAYDTLVGERGVRLSGGQKQRVAIARALLKDPRILVLDEATSALDAENEHVVQEALERLMKGRTTLVIAHRLSTIQTADRVLVLDGGRVVEEGPPAELAAKDGLYRRLVERQLASAELG